MSTLVFYDVKIPYGHLTKQSESSSCLGLHGGLLFALPKHLASEYSVSQCDTEYTNGIQILQVVDSLEHAKLLPRTITLGTVAIMVNLHTRH